MKVKFSEHQADHFKEQAPVCGSTQSGVCLWAENQILWFTKKSISNSCQCWYLLIFFHFTYVVFPPFDLIMRPVARPMQ